MQEADDRLAAANRVISSYKVTIHTMQTQALPASHEACSRPPTAASVALWFLSVKHHGKASQLLTRLMLVLMRAQEEAGEGGAPELQEEVDSLHQRLHEVADREAELLEQVPAVCSSAPLS